MPKIKTKIASACLAALLLLGVFPTLPTAASAAETTVTQAQSIIRASRATEQIRINGVPTEIGWSLSTYITDKVSVGAQWDTENLYFCIHTPDKESAALTLNGIEITGKNATIKTPVNKQATEYKIALSAINVTPTNYEEEIPVKITVNGTEWNGTVVLSSTEWCATSGPSSSIAHSGISRRGFRLVEPTSYATDNQSATAVARGYNLFDRYAENGLNPQSVSTQVTLGANKHPGIASFADRTTNNVFGFTFRADSMPVYKLGAGNDFYPHIMAGFYFYMTAADKSGTPHYVTMGIVNTDIGLVYVQRDADRDRTYILNKHVGNTFHVETVWTKDGDVVLYVDGVKASVFENAEMPREELAENNVVFGILRSVDAAKSDKDNFNVFVTDIGVGINHGECVLDSLTFNTIANAKNSQYFTKNDLYLPLTFATNITDLPLTLKWESSHPDIIDPKTGKVTQPQTDGQLVVLTATVASLGKSVNIETFVPGLAPQTDILTVVNDTAPYRGKGTERDVHEFTFDATNNSLVLDQKESKTVNVIVLRDSDEFCRLNETNLTIWTSDNNKEYTQLESFKLLRDGIHTYLYDFEATGRYIKVHFTLHMTQDADFTAPLIGMIRAYHENVFGDGGIAFETETALKVENTTDADMLDAVCAVSPETAGIVSLAENYADVRFFLGDELLYHHYNGENFIVRVTDIPKGESVKLTVLSGNASAKDISNVEAVYEVMYGTRETGTGFRGVYFVTLKNGMLMGFHSQGGYKNGTLTFMLSNDGGLTTTTPKIASGAQGAFCNPHGSGYDDVTGRIFVQGYKVTDDGYAAGIVYSDNNGGTWKHAEIRYELPGDQFTHTYANILKVSSYDGADGPNVDFILATNRDSKEMKEHYNTQYYRGELCFLYTTDGGATWTMGADGVRFFDGEGDHIREMGMSEVTVLEADGVLVAYSRCQFDNTDHFAVATSHDFGITWSDEARLSNVYATNTQPELFRLEGSDFLLWGGNNVYGCNSFQRFPMSVAASYDKLSTFEDIQDLFLKTDFQGLTKSTSTFVMNPNATVYGDRLIVSWLGDNMTGPDNYRTLYVDNFTDYFFRTKGAYDSFESSTSDYEGWTPTGGQVNASDAFATDGNMSLFFAPGSAAVRSIPYIQNGTVSFDLYIEDVDKTNFTLELESSHGPDYGKASPLGFELIGNRIKFLRASSDSAANLKNGWNHLVFDLALASDTPSATLSINGGAGMNVPVDAEIGDYACFVHVVCQGTLPYYIDTFVVNDMDDSVPLVAAAYNGSDISGGDSSSAASGNTAILRIGLGALAVAAVVLLVAIFTTKKKSV